MKDAEFFNKEFDAEIPLEYKLFEKSTEDEKGTWKPKFKIQPAGRYSSLTKEQILRIIKTECSKDNPNKEIIHNLVVAAKEKGAGNDELEAIIPSEYKDEEVYAYEKEGGHITSKP